MLSQVGNLLKKRKMLLGDGKSIRRNRERAFLPNAAILIVFIVLSGAMASTSVADESDEAEQSLLTSVLGAGTVNLPSFDIVNVTTSLFRGSGAHGSAFLKTESGSATEQETLLRELSLPLEQIPDSGSLIRQADLRQVYVSEDGHRTYVVIDNIAGRGRCHSLAAFRYNGDRYEPAQIPAITDSICEGSARQLIPVPVEVRGHLWILFPRYAGANYRLQQDAEKGSISLSIAALPVEFNPNDAMAFGSDGLEFDHLMQIDVKLQITAKTGKVLYKNRAIENLNMLSDIVVAHAAILVSLSPWETESAPDDTGSVEVAHLSHSRTKVDHPKGALFNAQGSLSRRIDAWRGVLKEKHVSDNPLSNIDSGGADIFSAALDDHTTLLCAHFLSDDTSGDSGASAPHLIACGINDSELTLGLVQQFYFSAAPVHAEIGRAD